MRDALNELKEVLAAGGFLKSWSADLYYGGERLLAQIPLTDVKISHDGTAAIQGSMTASIAYTSDVAQSFTPREIGDVFAPFGAELVIFAKVSLGTAQYSVPIGWFRLTNVPSAIDETTQFGGRTITIGTLLDLELKDRFAIVENNPFDAPQSSKLLGSVYDEFARVTGLTITETVPDQGIPGTVAYEESRLDAAYALVDTIDAVPYMMADGTASFRPNAWPAPVDRLRRGENGTLIDVKPGMDPTGVYNRVVFRGTDAKGSAILAVAEQKQGYLRVRDPDGSPGPAGIITRFLASDYIKTVVAAQAYVNRELPRTARLGAQVITINETFNPLREVGDVLELERPTEVWIVRLKTVSMDMTGMTQSTAEVSIG